MRPDKITRRKFVASTAGAAVGAVIVPRHVLGGPGYQPPSDTLNIAVVGCGAQGAGDATELVTGGENIVALADIDFGFVDKAVAGRLVGRDGQPNPAAAKLQDAYGKAKRYADFRKMLEQQKDIDAVLVATPDHTHAVVAKAAMDLGKHVYVEKPLTWSVHEARVLRETAKRTKVVTQMGNQGHSSHDARLINEWIQAGIIGPVKDVHVWTNRPIWPQGIPRPSKTFGTAPTAPPIAAGPGAIQAPGQGSAPTGAGQPPPGFGNTRDWNQRRLNQEIARALAEHAAAPSGIEWDLFLGPAPDVPYHPMYHPFNWRGWVEWGTGALGDMAAHLVDHPYWALGLTYPTTIEATSTPFGPDENGSPASYPMAMEVVYHFPARGSQPPVTMTWRDGGLMPGRPDVLPESVILQRGGGVIIVGEKGILLHDTYGRNPRLYPETLMEAALKVPQRYERIETDERQNALRQAQGAPSEPRGALHKMNWAKAAKGQAKASCPFEYAGPLTETMLLGIVAIKTGQGKPIHYDGETGTITNEAGANQFLRREYRKSWSL